MDRYVKTLWEDGITDIDAAPMNNIEIGIDNATNKVIELEEQIGNVGSVLDAINGTEI